MRTLSARAVPLVALGAALFGCTSTTLPAGSLADPSAIVSAPTANQPGNILVMVAEGDGHDLRAFIQYNHIFVRGPNAISALSIPLSITINNVFFDSFRATRLAGGEIGEVTNGGTGFVVAAGTANRVQMVDTQTLLTTASASDLDCTQTPTPELPSCLPEPALDVVTAPPQSANVYVLLAPDATGKQVVLQMQAALENQNGVNVPVLHLVPPTAANTLPPGHWARLNSAPDGSALYVADTTPGTTTGVLQVSLPSLTMTPFTTSGPVRTAVPTPDGKYVLDVLTDGRIETLDLSLGSTALEGPILLADGGTIQPDGGYPRTADGGFLYPLPLVPMSFGPPAEDVVFMPCTSSACLRTGANTTVGGGDNGAIAFVALGDGTIASIADVDPLAPQIYQVISSGNSAPDVVTAPVYSPLPLSGLQPVSMNVAAGDLGRTRSEVITAEYFASLPGFLGRPGLLADAGVPDGGATDGGPMFVLTDIAGPDGGTASDGGFPGIVCVQESPPADGGAPTFDGGPAVDAGALPAPAPNCAVPLPPSGNTPGDMVRITSLEPSCSLVYAEMNIVSVSLPTFVVQNATPLPCFPSRVVYDVLAAADPSPYVQNASGPWVVTGSASGYLGRASTGPPGGAPSPLFTYAGVQFFYPIEFPGSYSFFFSLQQTAAPSQADNISLTLGSGFAPFIMSTTASQSSLAFSLAVVGNYLYVAIVGANSLTEINAPIYTEANSENDYE